MAASQPRNTKTQELLEDELTLSKDQIWFGFSMSLYQGFWRLNILSENINAFQTQFKADDTDIILASQPKTGTTWLKALLFTIVNRQKFSNKFSQHPLHTQNPHELVPFLEINIYNDNNDNNDNNENNHLDLTKIPLPRVLATHMPYPSLPESIKTSKCRIVYVSRNPLDTFVSLWKFYLQFDKSKEMELNMKIMEEYVGKFCMGISPYGPYDEHVLGYSNESIQNPDKVLFVEYEGIMKEPKVHLKKLAEFVGCPFSEEEEKRNVIDEIIKLCSLKSLKEMEINKSGKLYPWVENKAFFRKGEVGDWINHLTPSMVKQFDEMQDKLKKHGFSFRYYQNNEPMA